MSAIALPASRIQRLSTSRRVIGAAIAVALVVHAPIYPTLWNIIDSVLHKDKDDDAQVDSEVPVELDLDSDALAVKLPDQAPPPPPKATTDANGDTPLDAGPRDAGPPDAPIDAAPPPDAAPSDAGPPPIPDQTPQEKTPSEEVDAPPNPSGNVNNVEIVLVGKQLRNHPVGAKMGQLLPNLRQWRDFFADSNIDAVRDADLIVLTGPQMARHSRNDKVGSGQVDGILVWNIPMDRVKGALDGVVKRSNGSWLEGAATPTALGSADDADRMFVMIPDKSMLYVTPPPHPQKGEKWSDEEKVLEEKKKVEKILKFKPPKGDLPFAILVSVKEPGKLSRFAVPTGIGDMTMSLQLVPSTVEKFVFRVDPLPEGEAMARIELWDDNAKDAEADVSTVQSNWGLAQAGSHIALSIDLPDATFATKGRVIFADAKVTRGFLDATFALGVQMMNKENKMK